MTSFWLFRGDTVNFTRTPGDICQPFHMAQRRALPIIQNTHYVITRRWFWQVSHNTRQHGQGTTRPYFRKDIQDITNHRMSLVARGKSLAFQGKEGGLESFDMNLTRWPKVCTWTKWTWQLRQLSSMIWLLVMLRVSPKSLDFKTITIAKNIRVPQRYSSSTFSSPSSSEVDG